MLALAIGKFDALHIGHRALVERAATLGEPALLGFAGMAQVLGWTLRTPLVAPADRQRVLEGWRHSLREIELPFAEIRNLAPAEFLARLVAIGAGAIVVGEDFRFGRDRAAGAAELPELCRVAGLRWAVVPTVRIAGDVVSSSAVRAALAAGDVALTTRLLGRPYRLQGTVVRGDGRGRTIGFPTANCAGFLNQEPGGGVYAACAGLPGDVTWPAAVNAGYMPTLGDRRPFVVEAHLIGFTGECYDSAISLDLIARIRDERRFPSLDALKTQIASDVAEARRIVACSRP